MKLKCRKSDPQALKAVLAAGSAKLTIDAVAPGREAAAAHCAPAGPAPPQEFPLLLVDGDAPGSLSDPNAIARRVGGERVLPKEATGLVETWCEWEETVLRPAVYGTGADLAAALKKLEGAVKKGASVTGHAQPNTLADVVIAGTLHAAAPLPAGGAAAAYVQSVLAACGYKDDKYPMDAVADVVAEDRAAALQHHPKAPIPGAKNILITSALPYVNNVPHLGNIIGCVLSADAFSRFCRARGYNTLYVCGTDEYGTATETRAIEMGVTEQELCDHFHAIHAEIYEWFDIDFDKFGRTPTRAQTEIAQGIFRDLHGRGLLSVQTMEQLYSEKLGKFLADRYVSGKCPKCGYDDARGDQCDGCGNLLNPTELIEPRCKFTGTKPVMRKTKHAFLDLPQLEGELKKYVEAASAQGGWSANCLATTHAWIRDGLKQRCITRDLKWGTRVPLEELQDKVFYVWFDAPIGYLSITANYTTEWERWWKNPRDVELVQFMGKDNVPFHTVIFPCTLLGTGGDWTMMHRISVTEYLNYEGGKFSKSRGTGVFGGDARDTGIPVEVWRFYLLSNRPESADSDFQWDDLARKNNSELLANLGNYVNRCMNFVFSRFDGVVPAAARAGPQAEAVAALGREVGELCAKYVDLMDRIKLRDGLFQAMMVSKAGNLFIQENKPWDLFKADKGACGTLMAATIGLVGVLAVLMQPFMPSFSRKVLSQLNLPWDFTLCLDDTFLARVQDIATFVPAGHRINKPAPIFRMISDDEVASFRAKYGGRQAAPAASGDGKKDAGDKKGEASGAGKTDKKEKKAAGGGGAKGAAAADRPVDVTRVDLRVGVIRKAWKHPEAESLYVEEIDLGEESGPRTVVSGLVKFIPEDQMQNRRVVCVCNLKPAKMRGILSQAMVLAASDKAGEKVELVTPPEGVPPGERLTFQGYEGEPDAQLNPKKKVFEGVSPDFTSREDKICTYKGVPFMTSKGPCTVDSIVGADIR
ncbi:unnamed protein product [Pedinophyceae sp. YPF-701]|nr:unnamed protein product [Pedinophyceae sp. YPF-701]